MLKAGLKKIIVAIITAEAKLALKKYRPKLVGVTGSVGKTTTKDFICTVLAADYRVRKSQKSFNSEIGVPLTILGQPNAWSSVAGWLEVIFEGLVLLVIKETYPEWLVLEIGADRPGDIKRLADWLKLDVAVITQLPEVPAHIEFFPSRESLVAEKSILAKTLSSHGVAVLNYDDPDVLALKNKTRAKVITYGFSEGADLRATNEHVMYRDTADGKIPEGLTCKVDYKGSNLPLRLPGVLGRHQIYGALAALAVGMSQELNPVTMTEALTRHKSPPGRLNLVKGIKSSWLIDDTYNSSPAAADAALDTLAAIETTGRRIAVLGDMMELGGYTAPVHTLVGEHAATICDLIVTVGLRAKFINEGAAAKKFPAKKLFHFDDATSAGQALQQLIKPGDLILIKGSQSMRLEKTVEEIMAEPERKTELLCRQEPEWQKK